MGRQARLFAIGSSLLALCVCFAACQGESGDRKAYRDHGFSMAELDGWAEKTERGSLVFVGPEEIGLAHNTIAIRSVPVEGDWTDRRTAKLVIPATRKVVSALPGAELLAERQLAHKRFEGKAFDLVFEPRKKKGERYGREHVVLVGKKRVLHLIHTAPEGDLEKSTEVFDHIVDSIREEG
jgi:hypothetical protein